MSDNEQQPSQPTDDRFKPDNKSKRGDGSNKPWSIGKDDMGRPLYHREFVEFLANPMDKRTYDQFCADVGISYTTLYRYQKENRAAIAAEVEKARRTFNSDMRSKAYKILEKKMEKDTNALKLFFQLAGDLVERTESKVEMMTPDEKRERAKKLFSDLKHNSLIRNTIPEVPSEEDGKSAS